MQRPLTPRVYLAILLVTLLGALAGCFANMLFFSRDAIVRCNPDGVDAHHYMAGCSSAYFGDYEHPALFFGLEPEANASMKRADVLVLGNSRAMWAFSTQATDTSFRKSGLSYYVLGFGADEKMRFASALIKRHELRPRAVIINADPFFVDKTNPEYDVIIEGRFETLLPNLMRRYVQRWLASWCANPQRLFAASTCKEPSLFRSTTDGRWGLQHYTSRTERDPINLNPDFQLEGVDQFVANARRFRDLLGLAPECVILTSVPSNLQTENAARAIAGKLGWRYIEPKLTDLRTIDGTHLAPESAERWSAALFALIGHTMSSCIQAPRS